MRIRKAKINAIIMLNSHGRDSEARVESVISVKAGCTKNDHFKVLWISAGDVDDGYFVVDISMNYEKRSIFGSSMAKIQEVADKFLKEIVEVNGYTLSNTELSISPVKKGIFCKPVVA